MADNILDIQNTSIGASYPYLYSTVRSNTNIQAEDSFKRFTGLAALSATSAIGFPQVTQIGQSMIGGNGYNINRMYNSVPFEKLKNTPGVTYQDFRNRKGLEIAGVSDSFPSVQLNGAAAALRRNSSPITKLYAATSAIPNIGVYSLFNREAGKNFGAGWGDHDNPYALRLDFTAQSNVATQWTNNQWIPTKNVLSQATAFRGDQVQVIDFKRGENNQGIKLSAAYQWKPSILGSRISDILGLGQTQDFIKFYMTGPKLLPTDTTNTDDIIVFRAILDSLTDSFQPNWTPQQMIGRADPNYHYTGYSRSISLGFSVYATDRDEMKPIWRKLNALAGYTAPEYIKDSIAMKAPWMRITIGDIFVQQPVVITSLSYTLHDGDTTWEINIEQDREMMQAPKKIVVTMDMNIITNELPQKNGKFYSLAKRYDEKGESISGNDNWLSDFEKNPPYEQTAAEQDAAT